MLKNQAQALRDETKKQLNELLVNYFNAQESEVIERYPLSSALLAPYSQRIFAIAH